MGKKSDPPPMPDRIDANQSMGRFLFGSDWEAGQGITDPEFQRRLVQAERQYGPEYLQNELGRQETALFGRGGQEGLLSLYERAAPVTERMRAATARSQREADLRDVSDLGADYITALRASDPAMQGLIESQTGLTEDLYSRARGVTPEQSRMAQQSAREATAARGRVGDNMGIFSEALGREGILRQNRAEAQQAGGGLFQMLGATGADPMMAVLGRPAAAMPYTYQTAGGAMGASQRATPQVFNPDMGVNMDLARQGMETQYQADVYGSQQAASGSAMGGLFQGLGNMFSFGFGGG